MITEEDLENLDGLEPEHKFCVIERIQRQRLVDAERDSDHNNPPIFDDYDYMVAVLAAAEEYGIDELVDYNLPWRGDQNYDQRCRMFRAQATRLSHRFLLRYGTKNKTVALDTATKKKISHWLSKVRELIQNAEIAAEKKDRLFALVDDLQAEVNRERTPVRAAGDLWMTVCTYVGKGFKELEPVAQFVQQIGSAIGIANDSEATRPRLPGRRDPKRIEPPKKDNPFDKELDDEMPF
jgi:hypothetical protein